MEKLRAARNIPTIEVMSEICGISVPFLSAAETGRKRPSAKLVDSIADAMGYSAKERENLHDIARRSSPDITIPLPHDPDNPHRYHYHKMAVIQLMKNLTRLDVSDALQLNSKISSLIARHQGKGPR